MTEGSLDDLVTDRMNQARETLREADLLLAAEAFRGAVNRAYYGMFYALLALLATRQLGTSRHSGAMAMFDREFVKTGQFPLALSRSLHLASDLRQTHDYGELVELDRDTALGVIADARSFVDAVASYLQRSGLTP